MELHPLLDFPRFSQADVLAVCETTAGELKGMIDRKDVTLALGHNPGRGRPRQYTGRDILKLRTGRVMGPLGLPLGQLQRIADEVEKRAISRFLNVDRDHLQIAIFPTASGEWALVTLWDVPEKLKLPVAVQMLDVDRLINETLARLQAVIDGRPLPSFEVPIEEPYPSPYSPENDFFMRWTRDEKGRQVLVGLTYEETIEYRDFQDRSLRYVIDSKATLWEDQDAQSREIERAVGELGRKHDAARRARVEAEFAPLENTLDRIGARIATERAALSDATSKSKDRADD